MALWQIIGRMFRMSGSDERILVIGGPLAGKFIGDLGPTYIYVAPFPKPVPTEHPRPKCREEYEIFEIMRDNRTNRYQRLTFAWVDAIGEHHRWVYIIDSMTRSEAEHAIKARIENGQPI